MFNNLNKIFGRVKKFCYILVAPKSRTKDLARREFILNILLIGSIVLAAVAVLISTTSLIKATPEQRVHYLGIYLSLTVMFLLFLLGYYLSRTGKSRFTAYIIVTLYYVGATFAAITWGIEIPSSILLYALLIVLSGILISSGTAFIISLFISITIISIILVHTYGIIVPNLSWKYDLPLVSDGIFYSSIFFTIALVSWLFNREMEKALERARDSELELKRQMDQLEVIVAERTQELKKVQVEKLTQLYKFAEFGKLSSGLFHELVTPLNLISLNLQQVRKSSIDPKIREKVDRSLERALLGTARIERYLKAARKQIQTQDISVEFSANEEINQVLQVLKYKAAKEKIKLEFESTLEAKLFGNPLKFNQLITNIVSNGIDAYDKVRKENRRVQIKMKKVENDLYVLIQDWGSGIAPDILPRIFEPLFTTKTFEKGTGIGLTLCKDIIEKDFDGEISVKSHRGRGTAFSLRFALVSNREKK